jgi:hypothetical protein
MHPQKGCKKLTQNRLHEYYTPISVIFQAFLYIFTIFVDYADFYVNIIMLTLATQMGPIFAFFNYLAICRVTSRPKTLNIVFASFPARFAQRVNLSYPLQIFVQLNDTPFS